MCFVEVQLDNVVTSPCHKTIIVCSTFEIFGIQEGIIFWNGRPKNQRGSSWWYQIRPLGTMSSTKDWVANYPLIEHDEERKETICTITFHDWAMWCQTFDPPLIERLGENNQWEEEPNNPWQEGCSCVMRYINKNCKFDWPRKSAWIITCSWALL